MAVRSIHFALFLAFIAVNALSVFAADKVIQSGDFAANVKGQSGKVEFVKRGSDGKFDYTKAFTLEVDYVFQKGTDGTSDVGKKVNNLASQTFTFSTLDENASYQQISAVNMNLSAYLSAPEATLMIEMYIFKQAGNVTFGNETFEVQNGTLKLLIKLENYTFCEGDAGSVCNKNEIGMYVDLAIVIKSKGGKKATKIGDSDKKGCPNINKCPDRYNLGGEGNVFLTKSIEKDGMFGAAPQNYPIYDTQGSKERFIFRSTKFKSTVVFDPTMTSGAAADEEPATTATPTSLASAIQLSVTMLVMIMLLALFM